MRATLLTQYFTPTINAGSIRWDWLSAELGRLGVEITVVGSQPKPFPASQPAHERPTPERGPRIGLLKRAWRELKAGVGTALPALRGPAPDVVLVTTPPMAHIFAAWLVAKVRRRPLVIDLRDTWPELLGTWRQWGELGVPGRRRINVPVAGVLGAGIGLVSWVGRRLERSADLVVTTSESYTEHLRRLGFKRVITLRNSAGMLWQAPPLLDDHDELRILYLGTVGRAQHLATAIEALAKVQPQVPVAMRIVGAGVHVEGLKKLARELRVEIEFVDRVSRVEVRNHYVWCDTALVMLRDWEVLQMAVPSKLYEAMAFGRHISASLNGEAAEIVRATGCGDAVPACDVDALAELWLRLATDRAGLRKPNTTAQWLERHTHREREARQLYDELVRLTNG